ncbi:hypothetical protein LZ31DRAFT_108286 [Colletotrichum somersetense]|nr:hypothetical protein LZ31DRAFT_108286 [Colletotrichum somersetense]
MRRRFPQRLPPPFPMPWKRQYGGTYIHTYIHTYLHWVPAVHTFYSYASWLFSTREPTKRQGISFGSSKGVEIGHHDHHFALLIDVSFDPSTRGRTAPVHGYFSLSLPPLSLSLQLFWLFSSLQLTPFGMILVLATWHSLAFRHTTHTHTHIPRVTPENVQMYTFSRLPRFISPLPQSNIHPPRSTLLPKTYPRANWKFLISSRRLLRPRFPAVLLISHALGGKKTGYLTWLPWSALGWPGMAHVVSATHSPGTRWLRILLTLVHLSSCFTFPCLTLPGVWNGYASPPSSA